ncbi:hypothetical protein MOV01_001575 [Vibrio vulnificus]|nr:hypothetical protein [Vibrio vulnificus]HDY7885494.1 hypothetical protein [Vibrio vulnificus]
MSLYQAKSNNPEDFYKLDEYKSGINWLEVHDKYESGLIDLLNFCINDDERQLIQLLLSRVEHFTMDQITDELESSLKNLLSQYPANNTYIIATSNKNESDGGAAWMYFMKPVLAQLPSWTESNLKVALHENYDEIINGNIKNIIIFDDFIGTGKTMINKVREFRDRLKQAGVSEINIIVYALAGMSFGIEKIESELSVVIHCNKKIKKGISDNDTCEVSKSQLALMKTMEGRLQKRARKKSIEHFSLGYKKSEALYNVYNSNCPNNVFPIFWWPTLKYGVYRSTLFNRL